MNAQTVIDLLQAVGAENIKETENWVMASCPLAPSEHAHGTDRHPSFGISITDTSRSVWRCFSCQQEPQKLEFLLHKIWLQTKKYPKEAAEFLFKNNLNESEAKPNNNRFADKWMNWLGSEIKPELPEYIANFFAPLATSDTDTAQKLRKYLCVDRGISPGTIGLFDIKFLNGADYLIFPLFDAKRKIQSFHARSIKEKRIFVFNRKFFDSENEGPPFPTPKTVGMWFGLNNFQPSRPVLITEGAVDALKVATFDFNNVVASMTAGVTKSQISALQSSYVVIGFDADTAGQSAARKLVGKLRRAHGKIPISILDWSLIKYNGQPCKDAADIKSKRDFQKVLDHAYHV